MACAWHPSCDGTGDGRSAALHLMQIVIDGAYRAPREVNFWLGLVLMMLVLGMAATGYLLPWDQRGYWSTRVATNLAGLLPLIGPSVQQVVIGGSDYGHLTLTRFLRCMLASCPERLWQCSFFI